jgi:hypothetical protein
LYSTLKKRTSWSSQPFTQYLPVVYPF